MKHRLLFRNVWTCWCRQLLTRPLWSWIIDLSSRNFFLWIHLEHIFYGNPIVRIDVWIDLARFLLHLKLVLHSQLALVYHWFVHSKTLYGILFWNIHVTYLSKKFVEIQNILNVPCVFNFENTMKNFKNMIIFTTTIHVR